MKQHRVQVVLAAQVGEGMARMLGTMGVRLETGVTGDARQAVVRASVSWKIGSRPSRIEPSHRTYANGAGRPKR